MIKRVTERELIRAFKKAPRVIENEGKKFIIRGVREYKVVAEQGTPWRVGKSGGSIPKDSGNLKQRHKTKISGLSGSYGVSEHDVPYAKYVHGRKAREINKRTGLESRPWLHYAQKKADKKIEKHYQKFMDVVLKHIAT